MIERTRAMGASRLSHGAEKALPDNDTSRKYGLVSVPCLAAAIIRSGPYSTEDVSASG